MAPTASRRVALAIAALALLLPASASATGYTLYPSGTVSSNWAITPSTGFTTAQVLDDAVTQPTAPSTASDYISAHGNGTFTAEVDVPGTTLGSQETVATTTAWAYINPGGRNTTLDLRASGSTLATTTIPSGSSTAWYSVSSSAALTQTQVNNLTVRFSRSGTGAANDSFVYAAYVDLQTHNFVMSTSATPTFSTTLTGLDLSPTYTVPMSLEDTRATSSGWNLTVTSTQFTTGGGSPQTLPTTASAVSSVATSCSIGPCVNPTNSVTFPVTVPAGPGPPTAAKFYNAASATGTGTFTITPTVTVTVPGNAYSGTYTSTLTLALVSGP